MTHNLENMQQTEYFFIQMDQRIFEDPGNTCKTEVRADVFLRATTNDSINLMIIFSINHLVTMTYLKKIVRVKCIRNFLEATVLIFHSLSYLTKKNSKSVELKPGNVLDFCLKNDYNDY